MRTYALFAILWFIFSNLCFSYPRGIPELDKLIEKAPIICVVIGGQMQSKMSKIAIDDTISRHGMECVTEAEVINVFRGNLQKGDKIFIRGLAAPNTPLEYLEEGEMAIVFLQHKEANNYEFVLREYSKVAIPCLNKDYRPNGQSLRKEINSYIISLLYQSKDEKILFEVYNLITRLNIIVNADMLNNKEMQGSPEIKAILLALSVKSGDQKAIVQTGEYLISSHKELTPEAIGVLGVISNKAYSRYVPLETANQLASSDNPFVREIGITILRDIGNQDSIPVIINSLKIQSEDKMLRLVDKRIHLQAVWALYRITGIKMHKGSDTQIVEQVPQLRNQWLKWWEERGNK